VLDFAGAIPGWDRVGGDNSGQAEEKSLAIFECEQAMRSFPVR
jgi:hypothetical protein